MRKILLLLVIVIAEFAYPNDVYKAFVKIKGIDWRDQSLFGNWSGSYGWNGWLCDGTAQFNGSLRAEISDVKIELMDGYIEIGVLLSQVDGRAMGQYRSGYSVCREMKLDVGLLSDSTFFRVNIYLNPPEAEKIVSRIQVVESTFRHIHFERTIPGYLEDWITDSANEGLSAVWASNLGRRINEYLSDASR